jgi:hypothetical protein
MIAAAAEFAGVRHRLRVIAVAAGPQPAAELADVQPVVSVRMLVWSRMTNRGRVLKAIDPRVEPALKVLARDGLPSPAVLELGTLVVCGVPRPDLTRFELEEDGSLTLKIKRSALRIRDVDPSAWSPTDVAATLAGGEELILDQGAVHISGAAFQRGRFVAEPDGCTNRRVGLAR